MRNLRYLVSASAIIIFAGWSFTQEGGSGSYPDSSQANPIADSSLIVSLTADTLDVPPDSMALITGGKYFIGNSKGLSDQRPAHEVTIDSFYIDIHEVTNAQYQVFLDSTGYRQPLFWDDSLYNHPFQPVVGVSWDDAAAYCKWAGKRLPTEAEWEIAACGGLIGKEYPWEGRADETKANYRYDETVQDLNIRIVGQYPPNGYGLSDMAGNVWEWVYDYYSPTFYADSTKWNNPKGPAKGTAKVIRGGSFNYTAEFITVYCRNRLKPASQLNFVGFRCAKNIR
ncbi:formylglycine-generating enzyme family protein [bacterium]|nr:formylglycine-generating enzyme family protein [FCB group bacterium]MBL7190473.1 formylglycine-generating enzyme family protein [bacterium]